MRRKKKQERAKPKYRIGNKVFFCPLRIGGLVVFFGTVTRHNCGICDHYYRIKTDCGKEFYDVCESEMSRRPERLIREARQAVRKKYKGYFEAHDKYQLALDRVEYKHLP